MDKNHIPVLLKETIELLHIKKDGRYIDATFGGGNHARAIAAAGGEVLALDWDPEAISNVKFPMSNVKLVNANFRDIEKVARNNDFYPVDGILFDLGISSIQLDESERGFSFQTDAPLDMRINKEELGVTAADLVNGLREDQLREMFLETSEFDVARAAAKAIVRARAEKKVETTVELAQIINSVYKERDRKINPATTIFLALRMAVNSELENLHEGLTGAFEVLDKGGRLVVISFHSGEDRVVKDFIRIKSLPAQAGNEERMMNLTKEPITPSEEEVLRNPRARSAKLRAAKKI